MPDRRRRAAFLLPLPATAPGVVLLPRERQSSSSSSSSSPDSSGSTGSGGSTGSTGSGSGSGSSRSRAGDRGRDGDRDQDNPFAPPPADAPDQEWRPRQPAQGQEGQHGENGQDGQDQPPQEEQPPSWGSQWSSRQPGRQSGGFGSRPGIRNGQQGGQGGPGNQGAPGPRWDPKDPAQRRARYALLAGMWAFFFVLFSQPEISLLLGALALYWGISSLRAKPGAAKSTAAATTAAMEGRPAPTAAAPGQSASRYGPGTHRPQTTAAIAGLVTASLALMMVAATFTVQVVYRDYFTCVDDALTKSAADNCKTLLPEQLRGLLSPEE